MTESIKRREKKLNKEKSKGEREGGKEGKSVLLGGSGCHVLFSRCFLLPPSAPLPPPCLPHRGDLDLEECAPCSVSGENRGGEKKELLWQSHPPHAVCERAMGSAEVSCFWMFVAALVTISSSFYKKQHQKFSVRALCLGWRVCVWSILTKMNPMNQSCI